MKNLLIFTFAFLLFIFASDAFAQDDNRASVTWQVQKYDITATLPQAETDRNLTVKAALSLKNVSGAAASTLSLRISPNATVGAVNINGATAEFTKREEKIGAGTLQKIVVRVPSVAANQNLSATVEYKLNVKENSGLNAVSPIGSQFLPLSFWYPTPNSWYFARGADFAPYSLKVNAANGETVIASGAQNGGAFEQKLNGQPFFIAGNWDVIEAKGATIYLPKGASDFEKQRANELAGLAVEAKTFMASLLGGITETPTRILAVRRGAGFADAGTIFLDYGAFRRQKIDSQTVMTIAEATAKIWLGNARQVNGDGFGAIREGLARFVATQFLEKQYGKEIADIERLRQRTAYAAVVKRDAPLNQMSPLDDYYFAATANKGAMIWRVVAKEMGQEQFFNYLKNKDAYTLADIRAAFPNPFPLLDDWLTNVTDTNLLAGLPQNGAGETKVALRNTGNLAVNVNVSAITDKGEKLSAAVLLPAKSFGEVSFKTTNKIVRAEIDPEKYYPQIDYSDDVAPREFQESDAIAVIKRAFDKQDFAATEKSARTILNVYPHFDDARILLARALLAGNKTAEAEKEFRAALDEKLPTARTMAWANVGLGEIALKSNRNTDAVKFFDEAIKANAEYGATLAARTGIAKTNSAAPTDESIKAFFAKFDKAAISGRKAEVENLIVAGEIPRFSGGIAGQAQEWQTKVLRVDKIDTNTATAEVNLNIRLLNKEAESGTAVFLLSKVGGDWKLSGVEIFEVR